jgi:hypothetical protein
MGNGRHDTGQTHSVIQPDDSTESVQIGYPMRGSGRVVIVCVV